MQVAPRTQKTQMARKAAFLDRDGVINRDSHYLYRWEDFEFLPGAIQAMRQLQDAGYALVVVTNQSGIARGMYSEADFHALSAQMRLHLQLQGVALAAIEYCPHLPEGGGRATYARECDCRKPAPGMILKAARQLGLDLSASVLFGDKASDIEAGQGAGVGRNFRVATNGQAAQAGVDSALVAEPSCFLNLAEAVEALLRERS
jgi:D-glycero-D-manno-heptose 1,7-bisphosphate phosphatase